MQMDCGLSAFTSNSSGTSQANVNNSSGGGTGLSKNRGGPCAPPSCSAMEVGSERSPSRSHRDGLHVNFQTDKVEIQERKKKFLTAKYGTHQMNLIKKRLSVEMWVYDQLQYLYSCKDDAEVELDLDELLDIDEDADRRNWVLGKLECAKQSQEEVLKFIEELLKRAKTL